MQLCSTVDLCADFARACEQSTDFHFASIEQQFETIADCLTAARDWRHTVAAAASSDVESDKMSAKSSASNTSDDVRNAVHTHTHTHTVHLSSLTSQVTHSTYSL